MVFILGLSVGKKELCALSESEATDPLFVRRIRNASRLVFGSLCQILEKQPRKRKENLSQKRSKAKQSQESDLEMPDEEMGNLPTILRN
jgi:hypothetical protein